MQPVNHYKRWLLQEESIVVNNYLNGKTPKQIGRIIGRTELAVFSKIMQIKHHPEPEQAELHNKLVSSGIDTKPTDKLVGRHVIHGMKLHKIVRTYETANGTKYVQYQNEEFVYEYESIKGSLVEEINP